MRKDRSLVSDGWQNLLGGIDSGRTPNLIQPDQAAFGINVTFRGGWAHPRPGVLLATIDWQDNGDAQDGFMNGLFQGAGGYVDENQNGYLVSQIGGRQFLIELDYGQSFTAQEITIPGDASPSNLTQAWMAQGENYLVIQDGLSLPFIYDGSSSRRAMPAKEIPVGSQITYYMGRFWIAQGRSYTAGDIVFGPSGTASNGFRDSILKMTENTFLSGGGSFAVPDNFGPITAMTSVANINTALGEAQLVVCCGNGLFGTTVPQDRATWQETANPLQTIIQLNDGAQGAHGVTQVNEDLVFRGHDGIRSLAYTVRNTGQWGNLPISSEMNRILKDDAEVFLGYASAVNFDNRMLMTASPGFCQGHGVYHRAICPLDYDIISRIGKAGTPYYYGIVTQPNIQGNPVWEGIWTGLRVLQMVTVSHQQVPRCFIFALNANNQIEVWELTKRGRFDNDTSGDRRIEWSLESRSMPFQDAYSGKKLQSGDLFFDDLAGEVDFCLYYRPDGYPCWVEWESWQECAKYEFCPADFGVCPTLPNYRAQYRPKRQLTTPKDDMDPILKLPMRLGYEFEVRLAVKGYARVKQCRINCEIVEELPYGMQLPR